MKKSLAELFQLPIEEVRNNFNITKAYTFAISRLNDVKDEIMSQEDWILRQDEIAYIDKSISHFQGNLDEFYGKGNTSVRLKIDDSKYK